MNPFQQRAVELAQGGFPMPNPRVGCVMVKDGRVVGEGWHEAAGQLHAEAMALASAGDVARGATCYVTLEPCNHFGRTPPCAQALIHAGVARVVIGVMDPNPAAAGGAMALRAAGISIEQEPEFTAACERVNSFWLKAIRLGRPYVMLKAALTRDGFMARPDGTSKWITNETARARARLLRAEMGAVMVGTGTVLADDPMLTVRDTSIINPPVRVVLDARRTLPEGLHVWDDTAPTLRLVGDAAAQAGDLSVPCDASGRLDLVAVLQVLWERGVRGVLVEGGPTLIDAMVRAELVDRVVLFTGAVEFGEGLRPDALHQAVQSMNLVAESVHGDTTEKHFENSP